MLYICPIHSSHVPSGIGFITLWLICIANDDGTLYFPSETLTGENWWDSCDLRDATSCLASYCRWWSDIARNTDVCAVHRTLRKTEFLMFSEGLFICKRGVINLPVVLNSESIFVLLYYQKSNFTAVTNNYSKQTVGRFDKIF